MDNNNPYISGKRVLVRYFDECKEYADKEGCIELRKNVEDIYLGKDINYAQVRICIDKHWYIKGIAFYDDNIPNGYDVVFYTKYCKGTPLKTNKKEPKKTVFKPVGADTLYKTAIYKIPMLEDWVTWQKSLQINKDDPVNHPSHYTQGKIECIDYIMDKKLNFCRGNAVKYITRAGHKDPSKEIEDLEKAVFYLNREITTLKESQNLQSI